MNRILIPLHVALTEVSLGPLPQPTTSSSKITSILDLVFIIVGAISLLVITIAGLRYITSQGNPQAVAQAKNAIIYAAVGLVVTMLAYTIVTFVLNGV